MHALLYNNVIGSAIIPDGIRLLIPSFRQEMSRAVMIGRKRRRGKDFFPGLASFGRLFIMGGMESPVPVLPSPQPSPGGEREQEVSPLPSGERGRA